MWFPNGGSKRGWLGDHDPEEHLKPEILGSSQVVSSMMRGMNVPQVYEPYGPQSPRPGEMFVGRRDGFA